MVDTVPLVEPAVWMWPDERTFPIWSQLLAASEPTRKALDLAGLYWFEFTQDHSHTDILVLRADSETSTRHIHLRLDPASLALLERAADAAAVLDLAQPDTPVLDLAASLAPPGSTTLVTACNRKAGHLTGCLMGFPASNRQLGPTDLALFTLLTNHIGLYSENAVLRIESALRLTEATSFRTVSSALVESRNLDTILQVIIDEAMRLTDGKDALVLLLEDGRNWFHVIAREGEGLSGLKSGRLSVLDSLNGQVVTTGDPLISQDAQHDPRANRARARRLQVHSVVIAPLKIRERIIGTIAVHNKRGGFFSQKDAALLCSFANQAAIAIDNARLFHDLVRARDEIDQKARELRQLLVRTMNLREQERRRIAGDIHDRVISLILGATYQIESWPRERLEEAGLIERTQELRVLLGEAIEEMRLAIYELWPAALEQMGLVPALRDIIARHKARMGGNYVVRASGPACQLDGGTSIAVYRIVQEALNNAEQHAHASTIDISILTAPNCLRIGICDNGAGFDVSNVMRSSNGHFGMIGMREWALSIGGELYVQSAPDKGTAVVLEVPLPDTKVNQAVQ